jgi:hypothetical protein
MKAVDATTSWTYTTAAFRQARASAANQLDMVIGVSEDAVSADVNVNLNSDQAANIVQAAVGIGVDSTTVNSAVTSQAPNTVAASTILLASAHWRGYFSAPGRHTLVWLEFSTATGTTTWTRTAAPQFSGISGELRA